MKARISFKLWLVIWIFLFLGLAAGKTYGKYGGGTGTENDPYLIYTAGQMNTIGLHYEDWDKHFKLMEDIDLAGISYNIIGDRIHLTGVYYFTGVFDGNNHKIINFHLSSDYPSGLFGVVGEEGGDKGEIKNVTLINPHVNVQNGIRVGSLAGRVYNGIITNCGVEGGSVSGYVGVGGLVGIMEYGTMTRCYATCDVSSSHDSYVTGGLLGTIWDGQLSYCFATGNVSGHSGVGGLMAGTNDATVSNCYATGNVSGVESVGGLMGDMWHSPAYIVNCYSTGRVSGSINVGGLIGVRYEGRVSNSFWDIQTSGRTRSAGGTGKTTAQMQSRSTYETAGWDFITPIWTIENDDYPRLGWQWQPKTIYVPAEYPTIQDAIDATFYQDTIIVAPGAYTGDGNRDIDFKGKEITVRSTDPNDPDIVAATIIDCQGTEVEPHRGFYFNNAESLSSKLMGFTITNGYADKGGAIYCSNGGPEIYKCTITNCSAEYGGGIWTGYGYPFSEPGIINCNIIGNSSRQNGGGIFCETSSLLNITNCNILENTAEKDGGAIFSQSIFATTATNCVVSRNSAADNGGGICFYGPSMLDSTITSCTISDNAADLGGGIYNNNTSPTINNCILWGNIPSEIDGGTPTVTYSNVQGGWPGEGNINADPCFVNPDGNDFHLLPGSPCIDAGDPNYVAGPNETDIDGDTRVLRNRLDIGADEYNGSLYLLVPSCYPTIQDAIDAAVDGDTVIVGPGTYLENVTFRGKAISLQSINGPNLTIIKGNGGTVVSIGGPGAEIIGFTIMGGRADFGAGMKVSGENTLIRGNIFDGNVQTSGGYGAAIGGNSASPIIEKNIFRNNSSDNQWLSGVVTFVNSSSPVIRNNIFENNNSNAIVLTLPSGNRPHVLNNTIVNNRMGMRINTKVSQKTQVIRNNILAGNEIGLRIEHARESCYPTWEYNLVFGNNTNYSGIADQTGMSGNIAADPLFEDLLGGDYHLLANSPCIDAGDPNSYFGLEPEPDGGRINMGAYGNTPEATCKAGLVLQSYNLISKTRISRTEFEYVYSMTLNNNSDEDVSNVIVELLDAPNNVTILDANVSFAYIAAGAPAVSDDTFSIIVDRAVSVDAAIISWRATYDSGVGGAGFTAFTTIISLNDNPSDINGDGDVNLEDMEVLASQWLGPPGEPSADIAPEPDGDGIIDFLDFALLAENWRID